MVFSRDLSDEELSTLSNIRDFAKRVHKDCDSHDYSHILQVCRFSIKISKKIADEIDPFEVVAAALLHDIGRTNKAFGQIHGLLGGSLAEEFLDGIKIDPIQRDIICRAIIRHTPSSMIPPETPLEKVIFDADCLDRLGLMGLMRGFIGKSGSMDEIMNIYMGRREDDFEKLHYTVSKHMGDSMNEELEAYIAIVRHRLQIRLESIEDIFVSEDL